MRKPIQKPKVVDKKLLIASIRKSLEATELPKEMRLDKSAYITDVKKFFDSHLSVVESKEGLPQKPYAERFKRSLLLVGIDIKALANEIELNQKQKTK
jgi:hypothetical protein